MMTRPNWHRIQGKWLELTSQRGVGYLPPQLMAEFHKDLIFASSNMEHIGISVQEVKLIVTSYPAMPNLDLSRESVLQAIGQKRALELVEDEVTSGMQLSQNQLIKQLHYELLRDVSPGEAGQYRRVHLTVAGSKVMTSMPSTIPGEMASLSEWVEENLKAADKTNVFATIMLAARAHHEITRIHPFADGNGRIARLYLNYICRTKALPYVLLPKVGIEEDMNRALKEADAGNIDLAVNLYGHLLETSLDRILDHYRGRPPHD